MFVSQIISFYFLVFLRPVSYSKFLDLLLMLYIYSSRYLDYAFKLRIPILQSGKFFFTTLIIPSIECPCSLFLWQRLYLVEVSFNYLSLLAVWSFVLKHFLFFYYILFRKILFFSAWIQYSNICISRYSLPCFCWFKVSCMLWIVSVPPIKNFLKCNKIHDPPFKFQNESLRKTLESVF